jgi:hypothetical protein
LVLGSTVLALVAMVATSAEAYHELSRKRTRVHENAPRASVVRAYRNRQYSRDTEADIIRAQSCDPAGRFSGYPAWARAAFTCGSQR